MGGAHPPVGWGNPITSSLLQVLHTRQHYPAEVADVAFTMTAAAGVLRPVTKAVKGTKLMEGAGVRVCRTIGTPALRNFDPMLMLDELKVRAGDREGRGRC